MKKGMDCMDNSISELQKVIFENSAAPEKWFTMAKRLEAAALTLQQHHPISNDLSQTLEDRAQEFMLWGFCIENLMKGLLARKRQREGGSIIKQKCNETKYVGPQHDLNRIANLIDFTRNTEERLSLVFFSKATVYFGRYPLPKSSRNLAVYWDDRFDVVLKVLLTRLKKEACI
jgi:hypothetical protein